MVKNYFLYVLSIASLLLLVDVKFASAEQAGDNVEVSFHGILKRMPCHIENDGNIYIDFGLVGINKINGDNYLQDIDYTLRCDENDPGLTLKMSIKGTESNFEKTALKTDADGLAIRLLKDGKPVNINDEFTIDYNTPPKLQAVPVRKKGVELKEQDFTSTGTLMAEYD